MNGELFRTSLACGLLPGVYRQALLARRRVSEGIVTHGDLERASALWFVNSVRGMVTVRIVDSTQKG